MRGPRKITKIVTCGRHAGLMNDRMTRRRLVEIFTEGGPALAAGCHGGQCRLWPGTDLFVPEVCNEEMFLPWTHIKLEDER